MEELVKQLEARLEELAAAVAKRMDDREEAIRSHIAEVIRSLPEPVAGKDGADGKDGVDGKDGENGKDGRDGVDGKDGEKGLDGRDGVDGRDALALEILPAIDTEKAYPRGTYATHNGGLWRSYEKTNGMRGWECIVDGVADIYVSQSDREVTTAVRMASGKQSVHKARFAGVLEKGVYKHGDQYEQGDGVTWAGSYWIAQKDGPTEKPGEGDGWRLAVKRGRDGKDGRNGIDATKGVRA
jgi:hypothetical protein